MDRTISHQQINQRAFLGAALMDPAGAYEYILKLTPGMFDEGACRDTYPQYCQISGSAQSTSRDQYFEVERGTQ